MFSPLTSLLPVVIAHLETLWSSLATLVFYSLQVNPISYKFEMLFALAYYNEQYYVDRAHSIFSTAYAFGEVSKIMLRLKWVEWRLWVEQLEHTAGNHCAKPYWSATLTKKETKWYQEPDRKLLGSVHKLFSLTKSDVNYQKADNVIIYTSFISLIII